MKLPRLYRVIAALVALVCMLSTQLAAAAYVCPGEINGGATTASISAPAGGSNMTRCEDMDMAQPGLCHAQAHDQLNKQSLDKHDAPNIAPFVPVGLVLVATATDDAAISHAFPPASQSLARATAPPIAIRNCCFRI